MISIYQISNKNNVARIPAKIEKQNDYIKMVLSICEYFLSNIVDVQNYYNYTPQLFDIVIRENRVFVFFSKDKYVSVYFPFSFNKARRVFHCSKYLISQKSVSHLKLLSACISNEKSIEDAFASCNLDVLDSDEDYITDDEKTIMSILLNTESCYIRYDFDERNENFQIHPLIHFDINFSKGGNWKIGLYDRITPFRFCQMFDKEIECEYLENGILFEKDKKRVITQLIESLLRTNRL